MRPKRSTAYCIPAYDLVSLLSHIAQTRLPKGSSIHGELDGASSFINGEDALQFAYRPIWLRHSLDYQAHKNKSAQRLLFIYLFILRHDVI